MKTPSMKMIVGTVALCTLAMSILTMNVVFGVTPVQAPNDSVYVSPTFHSATVNNELTVKNTITAKKANLENADIGALRVESLGSAIDIIVRIIDNLKITGYIEATGDATFGGILKVGNSAFVANPNGLNTISSSADIERSLKTGPLVVKSLANGSVSSWMGFLGNTIYTNGQLILHPDDPNRLVYIGDGNDANQYGLKVSGNATVNNMLRVDGTANLKGTTNTVDLNATGKTSLQGLEILGKITGGVNTLVEFVDEVKINSNLRVSNDIISEGKYVGGLAMANFQKSTDTTKILAAASASEFTAECAPGYFAISCNYAANDEGLSLTSIEVMNNACSFSVKNSSREEKSYHASANCVKGQ